MPQINEPEFETVTGILPMNTYLVTGKRPDGRDFNRIVLQPEGSHDFYLLFPTSDSPSAQHEASMQKVAPFVKKAMIEHIGARTAPIEKSSVRIPTGRTA